MRIEYVKTMNKVFPVREINITGTDFSYATLIGVESMEDALDNANELELEVDDSIYCYVPDHAIELPIAELETYVKQAGGENITISE